MADSPKKKTQPCLDGGSSKLRRPSTPHPPSDNAFDFSNVQMSSKYRVPTPHQSSRASADYSRNDCCTTPRSPGKAFDFAETNTDYRRGGQVSPGGCIGISLATVMNTFRGPTSTASGTSPRDEDGNMFYRFNRFRSALHKTLTCTPIRNHPQHDLNNDSSFIDDRHVSFDFEGCDTFEFERDRSLMQRAASWGTQETGNVTMDGRGSSESNQQVQFHYPPITSVRLRPRTESGDIKQLFFAPEELDEIEDDRSDTRAADDIETLAVGANDWGTTTSSIVTASDLDDDQSRSGLMLAGDKYDNVMFDKELSPRKRESSSSSRRYVRGVQIMLREKSTG